MRSIRKPLVGIGLAFGIVLGTVGSASAHPRQLAEVKDSLERFHSVEYAKRQGFGLVIDVNGVSCIDDPAGTGNMGYHYANGTLLGDGKIDDHQNWKGRFKDNSDKMRSGSIFDMADVLKSLTFLARSKSLSFREKRMLDRARALIVTDVRALPKEAMGELGAYVASPDPEAPLVLCCAVAERGKPPAALLKLIEPVGGVTQVQLQRKDFEPWLLQRAGRAGVDLTPPAARTLVETIGPSAAQLVGAVQQLADAFPAQRIGPAEIHRQFRGLGEQKTWDLCDKAFGKDLPGAIRALRSIEEGGDEALMVLGGIAARLRDLIRVRSVSDQVPLSQVAKAAGLRFDWQARRYRQQAGNYSLEELVAIHLQVTEADKALKSGATGDVVMPALVAAIAA